MIASEHRVAYLQASSEFLEWRLEHLQRHNSSHFSIVVAFAGVGSGVGFSARYSTAGFLLTHWCIAGIVSCAFLLLWRRASVVAESLRLSRPENTLEIATVFASGVKRTNLRISLVGLYAPQFGIVSTYDRRNHALFRTQSRALS